MIIHFQFERVAGPLVFSYSSNIKEQMHMWQEVSSLIQLINE